MMSALLHLRLCPFFYGGHRQLALENLALRQQLAVYKRTVTRPPLRRSDRLFWVALARVWAGWRQPLVIVTPATVLRWQRRCFREYWTRLSGRPPAGQPRTQGPGQEDGRGKSPGRSAHPWRDPETPPRRGRAHRVPADAEARPEPSQTWRTFLANHARDLVSIDFFTVPTARLVRAEIPVGDAVFDHVVGAVRIKAATATMAI
jgi:hypothetical protein